MPIYEYTCRCCGLKFDILHRSNRDLNPMCPECGTTKIERLLSVFGFSSGESFVSSSSKNVGCSTCSTRNCKDCK